MRYKNPSCASTNDFDSNVKLESTQNLFNFMTCKTMCRMLLPIFAYLMLILPSTRQLLEQSMIAHMLIQIPLLIICGGWVANQYKLNIPYHLSLPLLIIALTTAMYWMLPRSLDASLEHGIYEVLKFTTLPILLGASFVLGWRNTGAITKSFIITNLLSMLVVLGWLYIEAPVRLCNYYLINEQKLLGEYILYIAAFISLYWAIKLFIGNNKFNFRDS